tara:strand:- start:106 stop:894 length:789 start_codon:yes stop_codon:yes gene_type:complete
MTFVNLTAEQVSDHLTDQLEFLMKSAHDFDRGDRREYKRMAAAIRILFHETRISSPLIKQVGLETKKYLTSCPPMVEGNRVAHSGLICIAFGVDGRVRFLAKLDPTPMTFVSMDDWWNQPVIWDLQSQPFSRKDLILKVANQDGGAHVDPKIDEAFAAMRSGSLGWQSESAPPKNPEMHSIRQIAHEVLKSIRPEYSRTHPKKKISMITADVAFVTGRGFPIGRQIEEYQHASPSSICPCGSELEFSLCHGRGAMPAGVPPT